MFSGLFIDVFVSFISIGERFLSILSAGGGISLTVGSTITAVFPLLLSYKITHNNFSSIQAHDKPFASIFHPCYLVGPTQGGDCPSLIHLYSSIHYLIDRGGGYLKYFLKMKLCSLAACSHIDSTGQYFNIIIAYVRTWLNAIEFIKNRCSNYSNLIITQYWNTMFKLIRN